MFLTWNTLNMHYDVRNLFVFTHASKSHTPGILFPPACAMVSKSYDCAVRKIAWISIKFAKNSHFWLFRFSQKLSIRFERIFPQSFYTIIKSYMCIGIKIVWLGCEKRPKLARKWPKNGQFWTFLILVKTLYTLEELLWSLSKPYNGLIRAISSKSYDWDSSEWEGKRPKPTRLSHFRL